MKIHYAKYNLKPRSFISKHMSLEGILLRYDDSIDVSYSLYHPIASLGDIGIEDYLSDQNSLKRVKELSLSNKESKRIQVSSYKLCKSVEEAMQVEESVVKIKTSSLKDALKALESLENKELILDANAQLMHSDILELEKASILNLRYIEDPVSDSSLTTSLPVGSDFIDYDNYDIKVLKPTGFNHSLGNKLDKPSVVTSYMDHPLGQIIAARYALENKIHDPCGLMTHGLFEENAYSELLSSKGAFIFSDYKKLFELLENERWAEVS